MWPLSQDSRGAEVQGKWSREVVAAFDRDAKKGGLSNISVNIGSTRFF